MGGSRDADLWTWALQVYARPGVAEACLDLQDRFGQCAPYLLWAAWAAQAGRACDAAQLMAAAALATRWEAAAMGPLRTARRAMKPSVAGMDDAARETLRAEVKALELRAEKQLMQTLERLTPAPGPPPASEVLTETLRTALAAAARAWPHPAPRAALERLAQTLS